MGLFPRGSEWRKWDLHIHTPSSYDYKNKSITNHEIIEALHKNGISVVAITDHHIIDVERIFELNRLGKEKNVTVLAGIEFLADSRGKEPIHFIGIFDFENNREKLNIIWEQIKNKTNIIKIYTDNLKPNEVYCNLENTSKLIRELGGIVTIHAGSKHSSIETITNSLPHNIAQKRDIADIVDIYELGKKNDEIGYIQKVFPIIGYKPMILCSDNHNIKDYVIKTSCWIKADPTFEGLKQIIYEPKDRVKIQEEKPEQKEPYNLIDYVCFEDSNEIFTNEKILLNQNLNVIIGGKSTGKSILLREIARTINPYEVERRLKEANLSDYDEYEENKALTDDFIVRWIDGREDKRSNGNSDDYRKIIYIPQSYLNRIADKEEEQSPIDKLVEEILKNNEEVKSLYEEMIDKINENNRNISFEIENLFEKLEKFYEKINEIKNLGDEEGIRKYIVNLNEEIKNLQKDGGLSEKEIKEYNDLKKLIDKIKNYINNLMTKKSDFEKIIKNKKFRVEYNLEQIINKYEDLNEIINIVLSKAEKEFNKTLTDKIKFLENEISNKQKELKLLESQISPLEEKVKNSKVIIEKNKKLQNEKDKLNKILEKKQEVNKYKEIIDESINNLVNYFIDFYYIKNFLKSNVEKNYNLSEDLELVIDIKIKNNEFNNDFIEDVFNLRSLPEEYKDFKLDIINLNNLKEQIKKIINDVLDDKIKVKNKYVGRKKEIIQRLINDWFVINYQIIYDGDTISKMSPGKKSFVLLRLIVELDKSKCPLLIDQPEDDLDNRSVYKEVVKYIREKKKERQIIIATHNPNLVVAADAECVIVANQDGETSKNRKFKFEYFQGSLENTFVNPNIEEVLYKQGIKEHVCEILEGGEEAFEKRKNKYEI